MRRLLASLSLLFLPTAELAAQHLELPVEHPLDKVPVLLALSDADIVVRVVPETDETDETDETETGATLRARVVEGESAPGELVLTDEGSGVRVERPGGEGEAPSPLPRLSLELTLAATQALTIRGQDLDITVEGQRVVVDVQEIEDPADLPNLSLPTADTPAPTLTLEIESSRAYLSGLSGAKVRAADSWLRTEGIVGPLQLALRGGSAEVNHHGGPIQLSGEDSEIVVKGADSTVEIRDSTSIRATVRCARVRCARVR